MCRLFYQPERFCQPAKELERGASCGVGPLVGQRLGSAVGPGEHLGELGCGARARGVARTLRKEREGILNWWKRGSTNSFLEGLNPVVQSVRSAARGFRSIAYFRTIIFLRLGRLDFTAQKKLTCATH
ncbi:hypothetical protein DWX24_04700 [Collinsella sp. AF18-8]|nr:hypothetical protein DWX24_04700 [Collinsella sp. AF18-8]